MNEGRDESWIPAPRRRAGMGDGPGMLSVLVTGRVVTRQAGRACMAGRAAPGRLCGRRRGLTAPGAGAGGIISVMILASRSRSGPLVVFPRVSGRLSYVRLWQCGQVHSRQAAGHRVGRLRVHRDRPRRHQTGIHDADRTSRRPGDPHRPRPGHDQPTRRGPARRPCCGGCPDRKPRNCAGRSAPAACRC